MSRVLEKYWRLHGTQDAIWQNSTKACHKNTADIPPTNYNTLSKAKIELMKIIK